jgi:RimJ/RimL family protein N-acetyltransferase
MNIELRRLQLRDYYKLAAIIDKDTAMQANIAWPFSPEVGRIFIEDFNTWGIWHSSVLIGAVEVKTDWETAYLVSRQFRNQGIATQACKLITEKFANQQLYCLIDPENHASLRVAQKANMRVRYFNNN